MKAPKVTGMAGLLILCALSSPAMATELIRISNDLHVADGQPDAQQLRDFARSGGKHVIDLRQPAEARGFDEAAAVSRAGMHYHSLPITGAAGLTRENVRRLDQLLNQVSGEPALLHCASGNRVGALMALRAGWLHDASPEEALAIGRRHGLTGLQPEVERLLQGRGE